MPAEDFGLVVHGGAGTIERSKMTPEREHEYRSGIERALAAGLHGHDLVIGGEPAEVPGLVGTDSCIGHAIFLTGRPLAGEGSATASLGSPAWPAS